ncbi:MAG: carbohydrate porin [Rhodoplanes sp.]
MQLRRCLGILILVFLIGAFGKCATAEEILPNGITPPSIATSLPYNGDPTGLRALMASYGATFNFIYVNDVLGNVNGGLRRGFIDQGLLVYNMTVDFEKLIGWQGLSFFTNGFLIHNTGRIRRDYVGGINTIAAIEAVPTGRLSELWLEQSFWNGGASLRAGQLAADVEFFYADSALMFLQTDWPTIIAAALPSGGPAYPLSTPGVRVKVEPNKNVSVLAAVFNGDPAGPGTPGDEQLRNKYGVNFRLKDSPFVIAEAQFRTNQGKTDTGLASTLKLGAWAHFGKFDDNRFADDGTLLADPEGSGEPLKRRGNNGVYGVFEQQLYRPHGGDARSGITLFGLASGSPQDRSLINFWFQTGLVFAGMIPNRPDDKFGAIFEYSRYSNSVRAFEQDQIAFTGIPEVIQDYEANLELNYLFQIVPGWTLQPVLTYVWHPDGGASAVDALVIGARSIWHY